MKQILLMLLGTSLALTQGAHALVHDYSRGKFNEQKFAQLGDEYLAKVVELNLDSNFLTHFPAILQRMPNLQELSLENNKIDSFEHMPVLTDLQHLWLDDNKIDSFKHMPVLTSLQQLQLSNNLIGSFEFMPALASLQELKLNDNKIKSFEGMPALANLEYLWLVNNQISSFEGMPALTNLRWLRVTANRISATILNAWKQQHPGVRTEVKMNY